MLTICNNCKDPFYNQAFEEFIFQTFLEDDIFFLWQNRPAVVVGSYQNICREVHVETLRKMDIPVVRRMSGGGTVYHDLGNINYTYIMHQESSVDYDRCLKPVIDALNAIGVSAQKNNTCDIAIGGQKISGSAQRAVGGRILHHGTLLFQSDLTILDQITTHHKNDCFQTKGTLSAICPVTNIRDHLTVPMTLEEFGEKLLRYVLPRGSSCVTLTPEQEIAVCRLRDEKYHSWEWTWGKTPPFTYERSGIFAGEPIQVRYQAKRGIVSSVQVDCSVLDGAMAIQLLDGHRLDLKRFADACQILAGERAEELMDFLL